MNKDIKDNWLKALRSGDYLQGKQQLYGYGRYCCLGVLCAVQGNDPATWEEEDQNILDDRLCTSDLPKGFDAGLKDAEASLLAAMNDGRGDGDGGNEPWIKNPRSFAQIADYVEKNL